MLPKTTVVTMSPNRVFLSVDKLGRAAGVSLVGCAHSTTAEPGSAIVHPTLPTRDQVGPKVFVILNLSWSKRRAEINLGALKTSKHS